jgi:hypothetical protein
MDNSIDLDTLAVRLAYLESQLQRFRTIAVFLASVLLIAGVCGAGRKLIGGEKVDELTIGVLHCEEIVVMDKHGQTRASLVGDSENGDAKLLLFDRPFKKSNSTGLIALSAKPGEMSIAISESEPSKGLVVMDVGQKTAPRQVVRDAQGKVLFATPTE